MNTARFSAAYATALAAYAQKGGEEALHAAYELGREAVALRLNIVELARVHHSALDGAITDRPPAEYATAVQAGGDFLAEALSAFEIVRRGYEETREIAAVERRHATILRRLSTLLADTSLSIDAKEALGEILQLVAEGACELTGADGCMAVVRERGTSRMVAVSGTATERSETTIVVPLTALDGRVLGALALVYDGGDRSTELDEAILGHLAQMAAAAVDRARLYERS